MTLDGRQIKFAVLESTARKFTGLSEPAALDRAQRIQHRGNHRMAAVELNFGNVLAGLAVRRRKPKRQRFIARDAHSNTVEGYFSILKRGIYGTYRKHSGKGACR